VNLKKMGGKSYWIEFYDDTGRRRRERVGPSKTAAEQRLREVLKARTEERHIEKDKSSRVTLAELCKWYRSLPEVQAKLSLVRDQCAIKNLLRLLAGSTKIRDLTSGKIEAYQKRRLTELSSRRKGETTKPATVNKEVICLKTILNRAVRYGKIERNPVADVKKIPENNVRMRTLSEDEFESLLAACPDYLKPVVLTAFYTAMRKSEILSLTWDEVDKRGDFIRLKAPMTKTKVARAIPLHPRVKEVFDAIPRAVHTKRVFLRDGNPFSDFKRSFKTACKQAGLEDFTFHDLRHCAINNLRLAGNDHFLIMAVSGHKTASMFKRYNLVTENELRTIAWQRTGDQGPGSMDTNVDTKQKQATA